VELDVPFPGKDGVLGATDPRFVSDSNPFGIDPNDPRDKTTSWWRAPSCTCRSGFHA